MVARLTLDQLVGVRIPVPQLRAVAISRMAEVLFQLAQVFQIDIVNGRISTESVGILLEVPASFIGDKVQPVPEIRRRGIGLRPDLVRI